MKEKTTAAIYEGQRICVFFIQTKTCKHISENAKPGVLGYDITVWSQQCPIYKP